MSKDNPPYAYVKEFLSASNSEEGDYEDKVEKIKKSSEGIWIEFNPTVEGLHVQAKFFEGCLVIPPEAAIGLAKELVKNAEKVLKLRGQHPMSPKTH